MKHPLQIVCVACLLVLLAGCRERIPQPRFEVQQTDTLFSSGQWQYKVHYRFVSVANAAESAALQAIEEANIAYFFELEGFMGTAREAVDVALQQIAEEGMVGEEAIVTESAEVWESTYSMEAEAAVVDSLLVYTISSSSYSGGAHGIYGVAAHNYSIGGGYELTLGDLVDAAQRAELDSLIRHKLYDRFQVLGDAGLAEQGLFPEYIGAGENFAVTPDGITFYYNPYDIGCYAVGLVEVSVSTQEWRKLISDANN